MTNFIKYIILLVSVCFIPENVAGQTPRVSIQGTLKDAKGAAAADGTYTVTFKLYTTPTLGTPVWSEVASVDVAGGIYSHYLGSITPLNSSDFNNSLFLGVQVGAIELSPRTELTYAPYAFAVQKVVCSGATGDVKYSILNPTQFAAVNGSCWVPMDGRAIPGSKLKDILNINNVPDGSGMFLRMQEFNNVNNYDPGRTSTTPIATVQSSAIKPHGHSVSETAHSHQYNDRRSADGSAPTYAGIGAGTTPAADDAGINNVDLINDSRTTNSTSIGATVNATGANETRPKNLNFWIYVRIN
jgi:hypothetical protein